MDRTARQSRRPFFGALLIAALVALALGIFFLEDIVDAFRETYTIVAVVPDAPGLGEGSPVWIGGKQVGVVKQVGFMPPGRGGEERIWVALQLPERVRTQVRADSRVRLTSTSLIGQSVVDILPGTPGARVLAEGDTLRRQSILTADDVTRRAAAVRAQLDTALAGLRALAPLADSRMAAAQTAFASLDGAMAEAARLRADLQANRGAALLRDTAFTAALQRVRRHADEIPAAAATLEERYRPNGESGVALARLQARTDTLRTMLDAAAAMLDDTDGFIGRSRQDAALRTALEGARASLDSLVSEVRRNPLRFVF